MIIRHLVSDVWIEFTLYYWLISGPIDCRLPRVNALSRPADANGGGLQIPGAGDPLHAAAQENDNHHHHDDEGTHNGLQVSGTDLYLYPLFHQDDLRQGFNKCLTNKKAATAGLKT